MGFFAFQQACNITAHCWVLLVLQALLQLLNLARDRFTLAREKSIVSVSIQLQRQAVDMCQPITQCRCGIFKSTLRQCITWIASCHLNVALIGKRFFHHRAQIRGTERAWVENFFKQL
ncbi:MAG: hypothetical protein D6802_01905 [Ardenticatenia bacterium]|nr:MAG: hypothetical protein D6802_01905 [Ardenticatenia bacterium]